MFDCFQSIQYGSELTEEFQNIGLLSQDDAVKFLAGHFLEFGLKLSALKIADFLKLNGLKNLTHVKLVIAATRILPVVQIDIEEQNLKSQKEKKRLFEEELIDIDRCHEQQNLKSQKLLDQFSQDCRNSFNKKTGPKVEIIDISESADSVVYREGNNTQFYVGLNSVFAAARAILSMEIYSTQRKSIIRITGVPKSGKTTAGRVILEAVVNYLLTQNSTKKSYRWSVVDKAATVYGDMLFLSQADTLELKFEGLCTKFGVPQAGYNLSSYDRFCIYAKSLPVGSIIFIDEIQALFENLSKGVSETLGTYLRDLMVAEDGAQFVVSGSSTPALFYSLRWAPTNGVSFFYGVDSEISTSKDATDFVANIETLKKLTSIYRKSDVAKLNSILVSESEKLVRYRGFVRASDVNMLCLKVFGSTELLFQRVREIYMRDMLPIIRRDSLIHSTLISYAYGDAYGESVANVLRYFF